MQPQEAKPSLGGILLCAAIVVGSLIGEYFTLGTYFEAQAAKSWPTTTGVIQRSSVQSNVVGKSKYSVDILYTYAVKGRNFESTTIRARGVSPKNPDDAETVVKKYPANAKVTVYYHPEEHSRSFLEVGPDFINYVIIISPLAIAGWAGWSVIVDLRKRLGSNARKELR